MNISRSGSALIFVFLFLFKSGCLARDLAFGEYLIVDSDKEVVVSYLETAYSMGMNGMTNESAQSEIVVICSQYVLISETPKIFSNDFPYVKKKLFADSISQLKYEPDTRSVAMQATEFEIRDCEVSIAEIFRSPNLFGRFYRKMYDVKLTKTAVSNGDDENTMEITGRVKDPVFEKEAYCRLMYNTANQCLRSAKFEFEKHNISVSYDYFTNLNGVPVFSRIRNEARRGGVLLDFEELVMTSCTLTNVSLVNSFIAIPRNATVQDYSKGVRRAIVSKEDLTSYQELLGAFKKIGEKDLNRHAGAQLERRHIIVGTMMLLTCVFGIILFVFFRRRGGKMSIL